MGTITLSNSPSHPIHHQPKDFQSYAVITESMKKICPNASTWRLYAGNPSKQINEGENHSGTRTPDTSIRFLIFSCQLGEVRKRERKAHHPVDATRFLQFTRRFKEHVAIIRLQMALFFQKHPLRSRAQLGSGHLRVRTLSPVDVSGDILEGRKLCNQGSLISNVYAWDASQIIRMDWCPKKAVPMDQREDGYASSAHTRQLSIHHQQLLTNPAKSLKQSSWHTATTAAAAAKSRHTAVAAEKARVAVVKAGLKRELNGSGSAITAGQATGYHSIRTSARSTTADTRDAKDVPGNPRRFEAPAEVCSVRISDNHFPCTCLAFKNQTETLREERYFDPVPPVTSSDLLVRCIVSRGFRWSLDIPKQLQGFTAPGMA
ncbi:hypothetical protein HYFRA_00002020 [Hymenoscyphus fraxineus]|uniref:Uncharacterized protein n=1 Tax=Hymenoscyphus fraxineus TaxID=746836 RepID=A0A9N9KJS4_9HELO|nr:hypothetical protein HYFRA_00002020 [Hymenoscyphus fraxineus]